MKKNNLKHLLILAFITILAGCGGGNSSTNAAGTSAVAKQMFGYWAPTNPANESYVFFAGLGKADDDADPSMLQTGRVYNGSNFVAPFYWVSNPDGTIKINKVALGCEVFPLDKCRTTSVVTITPGATEGSSWKFLFDDNADGTIDRSVNDAYAQSNLNLSTLPQGEFFMNVAEQTANLELGFRSGNQVGIRMQVAGEEIALTGSIPAGATRSISFGGSSEANAINSAYTFKMTDGLRRSFPVKVWLEQVRMSAGVNGGFIVDYELHQKVQFPTDVVPSSVVLNSYELPKKRSIIYGRIDHFVHGPTIHENDKFVSWLPVGFKYNLFLGAGNQLKFTSPTQGTISHTDFHGGTRSEKLTFSWAQVADGTVTMNFANGLPVTMRFVKDISGGYLVVYSLPGHSHLMHNLIIDGPQVIMTENDFAGRYVFTGSDEVTNFEVVFHKDKTVTGAVSGYWFIEPNGTIVSYECTDLAGHDIANYEQCYAQMSDTSKVKVVYIKRLRLLNNANNIFLFQYDAEGIGSRLGGASGDDYKQISLSYFWKRVGNE